MIRDLNTLLDSVPRIKVIGNAAIEIASLQMDSRKIAEGDCFFALSGTKVDGHDFISQVIANGARAIVCEKLPDELLSTVCYIQVSDAANTMGMMANNYYDKPSQKLKLVGITGTNGKTTCVTLLHELFHSLGEKVGLISTVVNKIGQSAIPSTHTTPDAIQLNALLNKMVEAECSYCFMEVSSHAVAQRRIAGLHFAGGVFTNITHEHLDYHKTFAEYLKAKQTFFTRLPKSAFALSNKDDKNGEVMLQESLAKKKYYALKSMADYRCKLIESNFSGLNLKLDGQEFWSPLIGKFNAYNLTAVYGVSCELGIDPLEALRVLSSQKAVAGRFQYTQINHITGIVDYAHSPDALENVLQTIKDIRMGNETIITLVGCGGDRDRSKRPLMAAIACKYSERVILTSDNPRTEDPQAIIEEMKTGVDATQKSKVLAITDRREAIRTAVTLSKQGDIILLAGKGHETYQEINGVRNHFDDWEELNNSFSEIHKTQG